MPIETFGAGDDCDTGRYQHYLYRTRAWVGATMEPRDEAGHRDVEEAGGRERQCVRQRSLCLAQPDVRKDCPDDRGGTGGEVEQQGPQAGQAGLNQDGKIRHSVRYLMGRDRECRKDAKAAAAEECGGD